MGSHWLVFTARTPESISNLTSIFLWIWSFFSWAVFFHGLFWNTGFVHEHLQFCKVRQVCIIWSFTFFSLIIFIFRSTVYKFRLGNFYDETCFIIFKICFELSEFTRLPPISSAEIVEWVCRYMGRSSQNLQSLSSY